MLDTVTTALSSIAIEPDVSTLFMVTMHIEIMLGLLLFLPGSRTSASGRCLVGQRPSAAGDLDHAARPLRHRTGFAVDRFRQRRAVRLLRADLVRRPGCLTGEPGADPALVGVAVWLLACRCKAFTTMVELPRASRLRHRDGLYLGNGYEFWRGRDEALVVALAR